MKILKKSKDDELYRDYLKLKDGYEDQPSFYFDVTDEFIRRKMNDKAVVILSNIAEMKLDNAELLRTVANKLMELGEYQYAVDMFEKIVKLRGEHPQSYRDLALAYQANKEYQKSLDAFYKVMTTMWSRFNSVKQIVFVEMNNLIALSPKLDVSKINKNLIFAMPVDVRVVLGWSTDNTDMDIHVKDPYDETAYYGNRLTRIGGRVSQDITDGFGPEEFMLKKAVNGDYEISTNNFGDRRQSISGPTVLYLDIFTFYGTKKQTHQRILVRTENVKENNMIGTVNFR
jgi:tetratricopeptide (TPR) repeat protein